MPWIALVGPELEENLSLRYLATAVARAGFGSRIIAFNGDADLEAVMAAILHAPEPPLVVGLSLAFQWRAPDFLALAVALREEGVDDVSGSGIRDGGSEFLVVIAPDSGASTVDVEVDIGCGSTSGTKRYRLHFSAVAAVNGAVTVETLDGGTDGGV